MPELPEVESICRRLRSEVVGAVITSVHVLRSGAVGPQKPEWVRSRTQGRKIEEVGRRGKFLLVRLSGERTIRIHLRMTGHLSVSVNGGKSPQTRVVFHLADGRTIVFEDPRALGFVNVHRDDELSGLFEKMGPEPLDPDFSLESFTAVAKRSRKPAKLFLMDQRLVAGLGNIYAAEVLFQARIHPSKPMSSLGKRRLEALHGAIVRVLTDAVQSACIAYMRPGRLREAEPYPLAVYGREGEPCRVCGKNIRRIVQGSRSTYYCAGCQR